VTDSAASRQASRRELDQNLRPRVGYICTACRVLAWSRLPPSLSVAFPSPPSALARPSLPPFPLPSCVAVPFMADEPAVRLRKRRSMVPVFWFGCSFCCFTAGLMHRACFSQGKLSSRGLKQYVTERRLQTFSYVLLGADPFGRSMRSASR
jgi:hypothetical protein